MKTLKSKIIAGVSAFLVLFGVVFAVDAMEKNAEKKVEKKVITEQWFDYTSSSTNPTDYDLPGNYHLSSNPSTGQNCLSGNDIRCKIKAQPSATNPDQPDMDTVVEIQNRRL